MSDSVRVPREPGYPFLPCPICKGVEGCDHTVPERARAADVREAVLSKRHSAPWSDEVRDAVLALEDKYDISLCSGEHLEDWVDRCEALKSALASRPAIDEGRLREIIVGLRQTADQIMPGPLADEDRYSMAQWLRETADALAAMRAVAGG